MDPLGHLVALIDVSSRSQLHNLLEAAAPELTPGLQHLKSCLAESSGSFSLPSPVATPTRTRPHARSFVDNREGDGYASDASVASSEWGHEGVLVRRHNRAEAARIRREAFQRLQEDRQQRGETGNTSEEEDEEQSSGSEYQEDGGNRVRVGRRRRRRSRSRSCPRFVKAMPSARQAARLAEGDDMEMSGDGRMEGDDDRMEGGGGDRMEGGSDRMEGGDSSLTTTTTTTNNNMVQPEPISNGYQLYSQPFFQKLSAPISSCLVRIAGLSLSLLENVEPEDWWRQVLVGIDWSAAARMSGDYSLKGYLDRIRQAETAEASATFTRIVTLIALCVKVACSTDEKNLKAFWEAEGSPGSMNEFRRSLRYGKTWVMWARGGGIFFILLAVFTRQVSALEQAIHEDIKTVTYLLRSPRRGSTTSNLILAIYLPVINRLRQRFGIRVGQLCLVHRHGLSDDSLLNDWEVSDQFFNSIPTYTFLLCDRDTDLWKRNLHEGSHVLDASLGAIVNRSLSGYELFNNTIGYTQGSPEYSFDALPPPVLEGASVDEDWEDVLQVIGKVRGDAHIKVATKFNASHLENKFKLRGASREKIQEFTKYVRALAAFAYEPNSLDDFRKKLRRQLTNGYRTSPDKYVLLDYTKLELVDDSKFIHLQDADDLPFLVHLPPLPAHLRDNLMLLLKSSFPNLLRPACSEEESTERKGMALHCSWYNRCATRGHDAPKDGDIHLMGKAHKKRVDASQGIPRVAAEGSKDERWETLQTAMTPVTDWLTERMRELLPEGSCTILDVQYHILPGSASPPVIPFTGIVININVSTAAHRDHKDHRLCLLLVIQEGTGGELVLVEPGVVVRLQTGSSVLFRSCDLTHLNMPYLGLRASIVFHSDQDLKAWAKDCNGWEFKEYFSA